MEFLPFIYSRDDIIAAGNALSQSITLNEENKPFYSRMFHIANTWRESHAYPLRSIRRHVISRIGHLEINGVTAARLKRMPAIRRKLARIDKGLHEIQDIGGCRVIVGDAQGARILAERLIQEARHELIKNDDYILKPKSSGYRSHHLIFEYYGKGPSKVYDGRRIEIQIRTRLQHSWATAVEAVGLVRGEYMKGSKGNNDWLRLFRLMSSELALAENCNEDKRLPGHSDRVKEIIKLSEALNAIQFLDSLSNVVKWDEDAISYGPKVLYYTIRYAYEEKKVYVTPFSELESAIKAYDSAEQENGIEGKKENDIVLVEADKISLIRQMFPNYFGDVQYFKERLARIIGGEPAIDFDLTLQGRASQRKREKPDDSWMRAYRRWPK